MLVISRRKGQRITIGDEIELVVTELHKSSVKLGIRAPRGYTVLRGEIRDSIETANRAAAETVLDERDELGHLLLGDTTGQAPGELLTRRQPHGEDEHPTESAGPKHPEVLRRRPKRSKSSRSKPPGDRADVR